MTNRDTAHLVNVLVDVDRDHPQFGYRLLADEVREAGTVILNRTARKHCSAQRIWSVFARKALARPSRPALQYSMIWCACSPLTARTSCGWPTSPKTAPPKETLCLRDQRRLVQPDRRLLHQRPHQGPAGSDGAGQCSSLPGAMSPTASFTAIVEASFVQGNSYSRLHRHGMIRSMGPSRCCR